MTENLFNLKENLPTPQYKGEKQRSIKNRSVQRSADYQSTGKSETEKKIENIMPLSYISPSSQMREHKESKTRNPSSSMEIFEVQPPSSS